MYERYGRLVGYCMYRTYAEGLVGVMMIHDLPGRQRREEQLRYTC